MKKVLVSALIGFNLLNASGIPVVDVVANTQIQQQNIQTIATWAKEAERWANTVEHYRSQLKAYNDQLISQTGVRDSVSFSSDINNFNSFTKTYSKDFMSLESNNSSSVINDRTTELSTKYNLYNDCLNLSGDGKNICMDRMNKRVKEIATYQAFTNNLDEIASNLGVLSQKLTTSKDIKESQDINNAIQLQVAQLQTIKSYVDLMNLQNKSKDEIDSKQQRQIIKNSMDTKETRRFNPPTFGN